MFTIPTMAIVDSAVHHFLHHMKNPILTKVEGTAATLTFDVPGEIADVFDFVAAEEFCQRF